MARDGRMNRRLLGMLRTRLPEAGLEDIRDPRDDRGKRWSLATLLRTHHESPSCAKKGSPGRLPCFASGGRLSPSAEADRRLNVLPEDGMSRWDVLLARP